jgi:hypothetical protein
MLDTLSPQLRRRLVDHCAKKLNLRRNGVATPFYLWERELRREVETVLEQADAFLRENGGRRTPSVSSHTPP